LRYRKENRGAKAKADADVEQRKLIVETGK